jgi:LPS-assembly protein
VNNPERARPFTGTTGRVQPQVAAILNYPLINRFAQATWQVEPIIGLIAGPRGGNSRDIPNEDSLGFEYDETSLFNLRRLPGSDRISGGQRVDYALSSSLVSLSGVGVNAIIGQSYRAQRDTSFSINSGVRDNASDIVGRISINPVQNANVFYRFRYDKDTLQRARDEIGVFGFYKRSSAQVSYVRFANNRENLVEPALNSLTFRGVGQVSDFWSLFTVSSFDLRANKTLNGQFGAIYQDECCGLLLGISRTLKSQADLKDDTTFFIRLGLKYLGDLRG